MLAFLAATVFGTVWTLRPEVGSGSLGQGLGLAVLAGLPLYACGALLEGLAREASETEGRSRPRVAALAALGAAMGFALTGMLLPRAPTPSSLLVGCLVLLSLGGMAYAAGRMARGRRRIIAQGCLGPPPVRVEERVAAGTAHAEWLLLEGDVVRAARGSDEATSGRPAPAQGRSEAWDVELVVALGPREPRGWRTLHVGGGASTAPGMVLRLDPSAEVTVLERAHCVVELGRRQAGSVGGSRVKVVTGNPEDRLRELEGDFDLVIVDGRMLDAVGGLSALSTEGQRLLARLVGPDGIMAWGPKAAHHPRTFAGPEWETYRRDPPDSFDEAMIVRRTATHSHSASPPDGGPAIP